MSDSAPVAPLTFSTCATRRTLKSLTRLVMTGLLWLVCFKSVESSRLIKTWKRDGFAGSMGVSDKGFQFLVVDGAQRVNMPMSVTSSCSVRRPSSLMLERNRAAFSRAGLTVEDQEYLAFSEDMFVCW